MKFIKFSSTILLAALMIGFTSCTKKAEKTINYLPVTSVDELGNKQANVAILDLKQGKLIELDTAMHAIEAAMFNEELAVISIKLDKSTTVYNYIDSKGKLLTGEYYKWATTMNDKRAWVAVSGGNLTLINNQGEQVAENKAWKIAYPFYEGKSIVYQDGKGWIVVNTSGEEVGYIPFEPAIPFVIDDVVFMKNDKLYGIYTLNSKMEPRFVYNDIATAENDGHGVMDIVNGLHNNRVIVKQSGKWGVVDTKENVIINPQFQSIYFDGKYYLCQKDYNWGWCAPTGEYMINPQFRNARPFNGNELAPAQDRRTHKWGYVDVNGQWVVTPQYSDAYSFNAHGLAIAKSKYDWGLIDESGKWVVNPQYKVLRSLEGQNLYLASMDRKTYSIINAKGKVVSKQAFKIDTDILGDNKIVNKKKLGNFAVAKSDFVDIEAMVVALTSFTDEMINTIAEEAKAVFGDNAFKNGSVLKEIQSEQYVATLRSENSPWKRVSDGWFGYKNIFQPKTTINRYSMSIRLKSIAVGKFNDLVERIKADYAYNEDGSTVTINGKVFKMNANSKQATMTLTLTSAVE